MRDISPILQRIKSTVKAIEPGADVILYGSYARGDNHEDSDIDLVILLDKDKGELTRDEENYIAYPLYDIEFQTGVIISPMVYTKQAWARQRVTPFYENVIKEGVEL